MNRKYRHLSREERYEIKRMYDLGVSINKIAQHLTRSKSTISMELQNLRYVIANMLKTLITQQCFIVKHFIISLNSWALYQT